MVWDATFLNTYYSTAQFSSPQSWYNLSRQTGSPVLAQAHSIQYTSRSQSQSGTHSISLFSGIEFNRLFVCLIFLRVWLRMGLISCWRSILQVRAGGSSGGYIFWAFGSFFWCPLSNSWSYRSWTLSVHLGCKRIGICVILFLSSLYEST